jgi:hypothetical protein
MSATVRGFIYKDQTQKGKAQIGRLVVNPGKVLPATATGNLFAVTGIVVVNAVFGFVSTVLGATAVHISLGVTGSPAALAANPVATISGTAVGSVFTMPPALGGPLPQPVAVQTAVTASNIFVVNAANITITTDATNAGAITWLLSYEPLYPKGVGSVAAV